MNLLVQRQATYHQKKNRRQKMLNGENRITDTTIGNQPNDDNYFKTYYKERTKHSCVCDICGSHLSCKSNLAKHKKSKKCLVAGNATAPCQKHLV